jgi:hypothetical protein
MERAESGATVSGMAVAAFLEDVEEATVLGAYLTDGIDLYRVVRPLDDPPRSETADLENCWTLSVRAYTADELWRLGLRTIRVPETE